MVTCIERAKKCAHNFRTILEITFGPNGRDVLLRSATGTTLVTNDGVTILRHLEISDTLAVWIKTSIERFVNVNGDYSVTFTIVLAELLNTFSKNILVSGCSTTSQLSAISKSLIQIKNSLHSHEFRNTISEFIATSSPDIFMKIYLEGLFRAFLGGKLNREAKDILLSLCKTLFNIIPFSKKSISYILENHKATIKMVSGPPLRESICKQGFFIERETMPKVVEYENCLFVLILGQLTTNDSNNVQMSEKMSLSSRSSIMFSLCSKTIAILKQHSVNVLITENSVPKSWHNLLLSNGIAYVAYTPEDEIKNMSYLYKVNILTSLHEILDMETSHVGCAQCFRSCVLGQHCSCYFGPPSNADFRHVQLLLCCASEALGLQYSNIFCCFLKTLKTVFTEDDECSVVPAGGFFEMSLARYIENHCANIENCEIVVKAILEIPRLLENSIVLKTHKKRQFLEAMLQKTSNMALDFEVGKMVDANKLKFYEPFNAKLSLYSTILEVCSQIVRVDNFVSVNKM